MIQWGKYETVAHPKTAPILSKSPQKRTILLELRISTGTNLWTSFPSLSNLHAGGTLSIVGNTPVVIGGRIPSGSRNGIVEIYDPTVHRWRLGPTLTPQRYGHSAVVINDTSVVVIGGLDTVEMTSVKMLNVKESTWTDLLDLKFPTYGMACGLVDGTVIYCSGGIQTVARVVDTTFSMDLSSNNRTWNSRHLLALTRPSFGGSCFQLRQHLYCATTETTSLAPFRVLSRVDITTQPFQWIDIKHFKDTEFSKVMFYQTTGYLIAP